MDRPSNPLHERYASPEMAQLFSSAHRALTWRRIWIALAEAQRNLGLDITAEQIQALRAAQDACHLERVAEIERLTRHDVVAHLRHYAEQVGDAGGILHLGATSAFITDNTDALIQREALALLVAKLAATLHAFDAFASKHRSLPCLAYTHFQPAQLTTVGKRAVLWAQDFLIDLSTLSNLTDTFRCRGAKGTTGTQASYLTLFDGDHEQVKRLDQKIAENLGFASSWPVSGQTYPRKQDAQLLSALAGIATSCHRFGSDLRLLQGVGELQEPFDTTQVGSSAMAYKRNPVRAERLCGLARRLMTDSLNGCLNAGTQWLERSLDDSSNRRLVLTDAFLTADSLLALTGGIVAGLTVHEGRIAARVERELPFMATETILMHGVKRGGDRQELHERIRVHSLAAYEQASRGEPNRLLDAIAGDSEFSLSRQELEQLVDPVGFTGRSSEQVNDFLDQELRPRLAGIDAANIEAPRV